MRLNDIGQNLFMKFHNEQKHEQQHVYVTSILEVAKKAAVEDKFHNSMFLNKIPFTKKVSMLEIEIYHSTLNLQIYILLTLIRI
jgi:hypothetical protein